MIAPVVEQPQYNLMARAKVEGEFQRLYERCGLGLTTWSPLRLGFLAGKYNDVDEKGDFPPGTRLAESNDKIIQWARQVVATPPIQAEIEKVRKLKPIADRLGVTQGQLAIAWCLKNTNVSSVLTGATKPEQVEENIGALKVVDKLTPEILEEIDAITDNAVTPDPARHD